MFTHLRFIYVLMLFVLLHGCVERTEPIIAQFAEQVTLAKEEFTPDLSVAVCSAALKHDGAGWILTGETNSQEVYDRLQQVAGDMLAVDGFRDSLLLLPAAALGEANMGIVSVSVAHLREHPRHSAQMVDQTIMGRTLTLLKKQGGWYLAQTHYQYIGWISSASIERWTKARIDEWQNSRRATVSGIYPMMHSRPREGSEPVTDLVLNAEVKVLDTRSSWWRVATPDGREGFVARRHLTLTPPQQAQREKILDTARAMMGIPYLWGGNSSKGNDCSGFTQTVFTANGMLLARDARQQVLMGKEIVPDETFSNVLPGDLLFFGSEKRITHVGISLGGKRYIHQGGMVTINSLDPQDPRYNKYRHDSFQLVKRLLNQ